MSKAQAAKTPYKFDRPDVIVMTGCALAAIALAAMMAVGWIN